MVKREVKKKYLTEFVYGATDGAITTFAVVAGAIGAALTSYIVLIIAFAVLFANGFSMAGSNFLSRKSEMDSPKKTAVVTFFSFIIAGLIPLLPFIFSPTSSFLNTYKFLISTLLTAVVFLLIGAFKGQFTDKHPLRSSLETFIIGTIAALIAFIVGYSLRMMLVH